MKWLFIILWVDALKINYSVQHLFPKNHSHQFTVWSQTAVHLHQRPGRKVHFSETAQSKPVLATTFLSFVFSKSTVSSRNCPEHHRKGKEISALQTLIALSFKRGNTFLSCKFIPWNKQKSEAQDNDHRAGADFSYQYSIHVNRLTLTLGAAARNFT